MVRNYILLLILQLKLTLLNSSNLKFGPHYPSGLGAVTYCYSSDGCWKPLKNLGYKYNIYSTGPNSNHPKINLSEYNAFLLKGTT